MRQKSTGVRSKNTEFVKGKKNLTTSCRDLWEQRQAVADEMKAGGTSCINLSSLQT